MNSQKQFFILGCVRSGTTLLRNIFRTCETLICPEETHFYRWSYPFASAQYIEIILNNKTLRMHRKLDGIAESRFIEILKSSHSRKDLLIKYIEELAKNKKLSDYSWFEKTPQHIFNANLLYADFPQAKFICIVRNPLNVVSSLRSGVIMQAESIIGGINYWKESNLLIKKFKELAGKNCLVIDYEKFVKDPSRRFNQLTHLLNFDKLKFNFDFHKVHLEKNKFEKTLTNSEVLEVKSECLELYSYLCKYDME